jgi:cold-inducible RNA-binding protein
MSDQDNDDTTLTTDVDVDTDTTATDTDEDTSSQDSTPASEEKKAPASDGVKTFKKLFIGNISWNTDEPSLIGFIEGKNIQIASDEENGNEPMVKVIRDRETGRSRGFAFVSLAASQDVSEAVAALDGQELDGRSIRVAEATDKPKSEFRPRRNFQGGDRRFGGNRDGGRFNRYDDRMAA